jgi:acyl-CoA synthetase (AMP-forming)/AMP-acid ligase II/acyl carrier protein
VGKTPVPISSDRPALTLPDIVLLNAQRQPAALALRYLNRKGAVVAEWSAAELSKRIGQLARRLSREINPGARVLVVGPHSQYFALAVLASMAAGLVPVPAVTPSSESALGHVERIASDCEASAVVSAGFRREGLPGRLAGSVLSSMAWVDADSASALDIAVLPAFNPTSQGGDIALLQYSSGSTRFPRGVVVTHQQLLMCLQQTRTRLSTTPGQSYLGWLPLYHDMGLIGLVFQPLFEGIPLTLMPPTAFLANPGLWMEAISEYRATVTLAPDFAYDLCARQRHAQPLDLTCLQTALTGAEPVREHTLQQFNAVFAPYGLSPNALTPAYGLAEATLAVTIDAPSMLWRTHAAPGDERQVVSCGTPLPDLLLRIIDRERRLPLPDGHEGEIWVRGLSISTRYWNDDQASQHSFGGILADGTGPFLCTGDLGFLHDGQLFVTGRLSDIINIRGRNIHPNDIETTISLSHQCLGPTGAVVGRREADSTEAVVALHELVPGASLHAIESAEQCARAAVREDHGILLADLILVKRGTIPKTTSGKVKRKACQGMLLRGEFESSRQNVPQRQIDAEIPVPAPAIEATLADTEAFLLKWLADNGKHAVPGPDAPISIATLGMDSLKGATLANVLSERLNRDIPLRLIWQARSVRQLARAIADLPLSEPL